MQGRVGNVVFYRVKGRTYIRSVPLKYRDANTAMQRSNRLRLMVATRFYQRLQGTFLIDVWRLAAGELAMNGFNLFMKMNLQVFNTRTLFEPPRLKMSFGVLPRLNHPEAEILEGNRIQLTWNYWESGEGAHVGDRLCVVERLSLSSAEKKRLQQELEMKLLEYEHERMAAQLVVVLDTRGELGSSTFPLPAEWNAERVRVYAFAVSKNGRMASDSVHLAVGA